MAISDQHWSVSAVAVFLVLLFMLVFMLLLMLLFILLLSLLLILILMMVFMMLLLLLKKEQTAVSGQRWSVSAVTVTFIFHLLPHPPQHWKNTGKLLYLDALYVH